MPLLGDVHRAVTDPLDLARHHVHPDPPLQHPLVVPHLKHCCSMPRFSRSRGSSISGRLRASLRSRRASASIAAPPSQARAHPYLPQGAAAPWGWVAGRRRSLVIFAMLTAWSPTRSRCRLMCSSAVKGAQLPRERAAEPRPSTQPFRAVALRPLAVHGDRAKRRPKPAHTPAITLPPALGPGPTRDVRCHGFSPSSEGTPEPETAARALERHHLGHQRSVDRLGRWSSRPGGRPTPPLRPAPRARRRRGSPAARSRAAPDSAGPARATASGAAAASTG
jgi:hypothetical protein